MVQKLSCVWRKITKELLLFTRESTASSGLEDAVEISEISWADRPDGNRMECERRNPDGETQHSSERVRFRRLPVNRA
jgi:hypothetical protein